jgi:CheY-like chemotaxis protein
MQGTIWIESELGKGSKFIFTVKAPKGADKTTAVSPDKSNQTNFDFREYTILVAEDMEFNREILAKYLEKTGISVDFAENGKATVSLFQGHPDKYNLILMDVHMPEMDGYEATQAIRALEKDRSKGVPIVAMTANVFQEDIEKCLAAGMNDHVGKPIFPKDLYGKLNKYLSLLQKSRNEIL